MAYAGTAVGFDPWSGAGAARAGGRWNVPGQAALYVSAGHATAIAEYQQDLPRPGTLTASDGDAQAILDLAHLSVRQATELGDPFRPENTCAISRTCRRRRATSQRSPGVARVAPALSLGVIDGEVGENVDAHDKQSGANAPSAHANACAGACRPTRGCGSGMMQPDWPDPRRA